MKVIDVFGSNLSALIVLVGVAYFLLYFAPVFWPAWRAFRRNTRLPRPWLFVGVVATIVYGLFSFLAFAFLVPVELYGIFVAPSLENAGLPYGSPVLRVSRFVVRYWWLAVPPVQLFLTWSITHYLSQRWQRVCTAVAA